MVTSRPSTTSPISPPITYHAGLCKKKSLTPHRPSRWTSSPQTVLTANSEAVAFVQSAVSLSAGLEIGGYSVAVAALEDRPHEGRADAPSLPLRLDSEEGEVPVVGLVRVHRVHPRQQAPERDDLELVRRGHRRHQPKLL